VLLALLVDRHVRITRADGLQAPGRRQVAGILLIVLPCLFFFRNIVWDQLLIFKGRYRLFPHANESWYKPLGVFLPESDIREMDEVTEYLKAHTSPDEYVFVVPRGPYNYLAGRKNPTMYTTALYTKELRSKRIEEIEKKKTTYIVNPITWFPELNPALIMKELKDYMDRYFVLEKKTANTLIFRRRPDPVMPLPRSPLREWDALSAGEVTLEGFSGEFGRGELRVVQARPALEFRCYPTPAESVVIRIGLSGYPPFMRTLAKPRLELISIDSGGKVAYEKLSVPTDGTTYDIEYSLGEKREITKLLFVFDAPGMFNCQPTRVYVDKVSLL